MQVGCLVGGIRPCIERLKKTNHHHEIMSSSKTSVTCCYNLYIVNKTACVHMECMQTLYDHHLRRLDNINIELTCHVVIQLQLLNYFPLQVAGGF